MEILGFILLILAFLTGMILTGLRGKALQDFVHRVTQNKDKKD